MAVKRVPGPSSLIDVLDRVMDKGIVIDAWMRISLVGIDLITVDAHMVVGSIETYLKCADAGALGGFIARPLTISELEPAVEVVATTRRPRLPRVTAPKVVSRR